MSRIIAIANQKGGVGKTTTAINLSAYLAEMGKKVLVIDLDPQGNTTSGFGLDKEEIENTVYELMLDECSIGESISEVDNIPNMKIIPSDVNLAGAEIELLGINDKEYILKNAVDYVRDDYDFVIIDCPPSLNMLTVNAMTTADSILVPIQCEYYALEGIAQLIHTIDLVRERLNSKLIIDGVVFTLYVARTKLSAEVIDTVKENLQTKIYNTIIPRNVRLAEAPSHGLPIHLYDPKSTGAESYKNLAKEVIDTLRTNYGTRMRIFDAQIPVAVKTAEASKAGQSIYVYDKESKVARAYEALTKEVVKIAEREKHRDETSIAR